MKNLKFRIRKEKAVVFLILLPKLIMKTTLFKIDDIIKFDFFRIPKALFANPIYKTMSSDAKLTYSLLYDRLSLSIQNNWINNDGEVFLIYTREDISNELGISYKKAISAFHELIENGLIFEQRSGRGIPNKIFISKIDLTVTDAEKYITRPAEMEYQKTVDIMECSSSDSPDTLNQEFKNFQNSTSRTAEMEVLDMPKSHTIKTNIINTEYNQTYYSQSVVNKELENLKLIFERCQLEFFDNEVQITFRDAIERLYYCREFKIGGAVLPQANVRSRMQRLDHSKLQSALYNLRKNTERPIKNITAYVMCTIFNCIAEEYSVLLVDPYLNSLRE